MTLLAYEFCERDADEKGEEGEGIETVGHNFAPERTYPAALLE
jgi:hypothetical protein